MSNTLEAINRVKAGLEDSKEHGMSCVLSAEEVEALLDFISQSIPKERLLEWLEENELFVNSIDGPLVFSYMLREAIGSMEGKGCGTCNDTGEIYTGETSCLSDDGDAPITERCPDCNPRQKVKVC